MINCPELGVEVAAYGTSESLSWRRLFGQEIQCLMHAFGEVRYCARDVLELVEDIVRDGVRLFALEVAARELDGQLTAVAVAKHFYSDRRALQRLCKLIDIMAKQHPKETMREASEQLEALIRRTQLQAPPCGGQGHAAAAGERSTWLLHLVQGSASAQLLIQAKREHGAANQDTSPAAEAAAQKPTVAAPISLDSSTTASRQPEETGGTSPEHSDHGNTLVDQQKESDSNHEPNKKAHESAAPSNADEPTGKRKRLNDAYEPKSFREANAIQDTTPDEHDGIDPSNTAQRHTDDKATPPSMARPLSDGAKLQEPSQSSASALTSIGATGIVSKGDLVPAVANHANSATGRTSPSDMVERQPPEKVTQIVPDREPSQTKRIILDNVTCIEIRSETLSPSRASQRPVDDPVFMIMYRADFILKQCLPRHQYADFVACRNVRYTFGESRSHPGTSRAMLFKDWLHLVPEDGIRITEDGLHALGHVAWELTGLLTQTALLLRHYDEIAHGRGDCRAICWSPARHLLASLGNGIATAVIIPLSHEDYSALRRELELFELMVAPGRIWWRGFATRATQCLEPWHIREAFRRLRHGRRVTGLCSSSTDDQTNLAGLLGAHPLRICFDPNKRIVFG
jgi:hypothetical protein